MTTTILTLTLEADGFIGKRQADAAAAEAARWLRTVMPYDVRSKGGSTETDMGDSGPNHKDVLDGTALGLVMNRASVPPMGEHARADQHEENPDEYTAMTVEQLRTLAGERDLEGRAGMRTKAQLIEGLRAQDQGQG